MAASCDDEPNIQHVGRHFRRSPARHTLAVGDLRALPAPLTDGARAMDYPVGCWRIERHVASLRSMHAMRR
jgi:hypothetical protein